MPLEEFIIRVYCLVDESLQEVLGGRRLRTRGYAPALGDAEVLTMEFVGAYLGLNEDKAVWAYFRRHWRAWFPRLGSRSAFVRQAANLWWVKARLHAHWRAQLGVEETPVHVVDGFPLPVCHFRRAHFSRCFKGEATYGYCAAKKMHYYGFKGVLLIDDRGAIAGLVLVPAHTDERDAVEELVPERLAGLLVGDKGYLRPALKARMAAQGVDLQTPVRANMKERRSPVYLRRLRRQRRRIETVVNQLSGRFQIEATRARDLWHLTARLYRKLAAHTLCVLINWQDGRPLLDFDALVAA